jgi:hypothetical protein
MEKQRGIAFGFWQTATDVRKPDRLDMMMMMVIIIIIIIIILTPR